MQLHELRTHPVIKWLAYAGFTLIIVSFVFFYGWDTSQSNQQAVNESFARYRSDDALSFLPWRRWALINRDEVQSAHQQVQSRKIGLLPQQFSQLLLQTGQLATLSTDDEAVEQAMDNKVLQSEAHRLGIVVPVEEVRARIRQQPGMNRDTLNQFLQARGMTLDQYVARLQNTQAADRVQQIIAQEARTSLYELWLEYLLVNEKITLNMARFPAEEFTDQVEPTEQELKAYLEAHHEEYRVQAKRRYNYVKLERQEIIEDIEPTEEQLKAHWEQNAASYIREPAVHVEDAFVYVDDDTPTTAAEHLLSRFLEYREDQPILDMLQGAERPVSSWKETRLQMREAEPDLQLYVRDLDFLDTGDTHRRIYGDEFIERMFTLEDDGISTPVMSPQGMHLIHRIQGREGGVASFEEMRDRVAFEYSDKKAGEQFASETDRLGEALTRTYPSIRDLANDLGIDDNLTTLVLASETNIPEIGPLGDNAAYLRRLRPGKVSGLFRYPNMSTALEVIQEVESYLPDLDEVRADITAAVKSEKAIELAKAAADAAYERIRGGEEFEAVAADSPLEPITSDPFTREERVEAVGSPLINFLKQTTRIAAGSTGVSPYGLNAERPEGYVIWRVEVIESPSKEDFRAERREFEQEYLQVKRATMIEEWLADRRRQAQFELLYEDEES